MEEWVQGRDIWQQEVDPVNEAPASGPDKGMIRGQPLCQLVEIQRLIFSLQTA